MSFYNGKKVLVTGASGLIGTYLVEQLHSHGAKVRAVIHKKELSDELKELDVDIVKGDLTEKSFARKIVENIDYVFHLAVFTGGLGRTFSCPATTLTPNLLMDGNILEASRQENVERFLYSSCACIYPNMSKDLVEEDALVADPPEVHASISWAKRMGERQSIAYNKQYGLKLAIVRPSNSYGPRDNFDPETSHVIGSLISKAVRKTDPFVIWGDGQPIREFIYAEDAAKGMLLSLEKYCNADPINLSGGEFSTIENLAKSIIEICGYKPKIIFDKTKPSGQLRRVLDGKKATEKINFQTSTSLKTGLTNTINWLKSNS